VEEAYTQQGHAHIRRLHPDWAARPALMRRAAHAVESKAVVRIEVAVSPRPCLGCAVELVEEPLRRTNSQTYLNCEGNRGGRARGKNHGGGAARGAVLALAVLRLEGLSGPCLLSGLLGM
jgi:hypothetical protein